jgi:hypothetical protein
MKKIFETFLTHPIVVDQIIKKLPEMFVFFAVLVVISFGVYDPFIDYTFVLIMWIFGWLLGVLFLNNYDKR